MSIPIRCNNILQYDQESGKYLRCQHQFSVPDDSAGAKVKCPQCRQMIDVPRAKLETLDLADASLSEPSLPELGDDFTLAPPIDLDDASSLPGLADSDDQPWPVVDELPQAHEANCRHCGAPLADGNQLCQKCGYHPSVGRPLEALAEKAENEEPPEATGFRLWLSEQLSEGENLSKVLALAWVAGSLLLLVVGLIMIGAVGWWLGMLLVPLYVIVVTVSGILVFSWGFQLGGRPRQISALALTLARLCCWRELGWPFRLLKLKDLRNVPISDDELAELEGMAELEVLDLESTKITDEGLSHLIGVPNLRCLVVRRTRVTDQGINRLLAKRPELWVWQ